MGDAAGIGPEIIVKLFEARPTASDPEVRPVVVGELAILRDAAAQLGSPVRFAEESAAGPEEIPVRSLGHLNPGDYAVGALSAACGNAAFRYFGHAVQECLAGRAHGIVTAPLNKEAMNRAGHAFAGHTEILEHMAGCEGVVMALWHPKLVVSHVTDHLPLRAALDAITDARVAHVVRLTRAALVRAGKPAQRIALAGVNPHAGENGLFGREEIEILRPAMATLAAEGIETSGP